MFQNIRNYIQNVITPLHRSKIETWTKSRQMCFVILERFYKKFLVQFAFDLCTDVDEMSSEVGKFFFSSLFDGPSHITRCCSGLAHVRHEVLSRRRGGKWRSRYLSLYHVYRKLRSLKSWWTFEWREGAITATSNITASMSESDYRADWFGIVDEMPWLRPIYLVSSCIQVSKKEKEEKRKNKFLIVKFDIYSLCGGWVGTYRYI